MRYAPRFIFIAMLGTFAATLVAAQQDHAPQQAPAFIDPRVSPDWPAPACTVQWRGSYSSITTHEFHRITDAKAWADLWTRHTGDRLEHDSFGTLVVPAIDFNNFIVIAIFNGESWNTRSMALMQQSHTADRLQLRFDANTYQTMDVPDESDTLVASPNATPEQIAKLAMENMDRKEKERQANRHNDRNFTQAYGIFVLPIPRLPRPNGERLYKNAEQQEGTGVKAIELIENTQGLLSGPPKWELKHTFDAIQP